MYMHIYKCIYLYIIKEPNGNFRPENEWTRQAHLESNVKTGNYTDGSIESDLPMAQLSELFNVNHFIVSQVSKHKYIYVCIMYKDIYIYIYIYIC
jgi:hypothetical protein